MRGSGGRGIFAALFAVSALFTEGCAGGSAFAGLLSHADSLCDSPFHGADRNAGFGRFRGVRRDCLLYASLCDAECDSDCGHG